MARRDEQRAWLADIPVQLRLAYEMNRQLLADSGMSLPDCDMLTALSVADGGRMQITVLAAQIGWERSRVSHQVRLMSARGLVTCDLSAADRRVTEVHLTGRWAAGSGRGGARARGSCPARVLRGAASTRARLTPIMIQAMRWTPLSLTLAWKTIPVMADDAIEPT
jgi:MarR family